MEKQRLIEKIRKLLNLSTSSNVHEASAAAAKAQALLSEYNLSMTDIPNDAKESVSAFGKTARTRQRLEPWAYTLAHRVSEAFDCDYYHSRCEGNTYFVGVGADPEVCSWTYQYLYKTLLRMGSTYLRTQCRRLRSKKSRKGARASYLRGVVYILAQRLNEQKQQTPVTESTLVPFKAKLIEDAMPTDISTTPLKTERLRENDWANGMKDGEDIPLSKPLSHGESHELGRQSHDEI